MSDLNLRSFWHAAAAADSLKDWPLGMSVLDEPVALVRMNGGIVALRDVCAHMDASLSGGWVMHGAQGEELVCPNHRWRYNAGGRCTHIPELGDEQVIPDWTRVPTFDTCEQHGVIWVCLDSASDAGIPQLAQLEDPHYQRLPIQSRAWKMPAQSVLDRFMDAASTAIGLGDWVPCASPLSVAWVTVHSPRQAILFTVTPLTRKACRSFWIAAAECDDDPSTQTDLETTNEQAYEVFCQAMAV